MLSALGTYLVGIGGLTIGWCLCSAVTRGQRVCTHPLLDPAGQCRSCNTSEVVIPRVHA